MRVQISSISQCSGAVRSAYLLWKQGVVGSNPTYATYAVVTQFGRVSDFQSESCWFDSSLSLMSVHRMARWLTANQQYASSNLVGHSNGVWDCLGWSSPLHGEYQLGSSPRCSTEQWSKGRTADFYSASGGSTPPCSSVAVDKWLKSPGCDPGHRGFESHQSPEICTCSSRW